MNLKEKKLRAMIRESLIADEMRDSLLEKLQSTRRAGESTNIRSDLGTYHRSFGRGRGMRTMYRREVDIASASASRIAMTHTKTFERESYYRSQGYAFLSLSPEGPYPVDDGTETIGFGSATGHYFDPSSDGWVSKMNPECEDATDNDGDGQIDDADPECFDSRGKPSGSTEDGDSSIIDRTRPSSWVDRNVCARKGCWQLSMPGDNGVYVPMTSSGNDEKSFLSIGYGHRLVRGFPGTGPQLGAVSAAFLRPDGTDASSIPFSSGDANTLLRTDLADCEAIAQGMLRGGSNITQGMFDALTCLIYDFYIPGQGERFDAAEGVDGAEVAIAQVANKIKAGDYEDAASKVMDVGLNTTKRTSTTRRRRDVSRMILMARPRSESEDEEGGDGGG
tara:strand:+ start:1092 stop:2267 length:1176 start_codon:yes stop_codon:yes gene_type:complete